MKRKMEKRYTDRGYGFPVVLFNVPMVQIDGIWTPEIDYKKLEHCVLEALAQKPARLTGNEIRFIRHFLGMNLVTFAERFNYSHPAVMAWERHGDESTDMNWGTEKDIRQELLLRLESGSRKALGVKLLELYEKLSQAVSSDHVQIEFDCQKLAA